jgi:hypothetical protein
LSQNKFIKIRKNYIRVLQTLSKVITKFAKIAKVSN